MVEAVAMELHNVLVAKLLGAVALGMVAYPMEGLDGIAVVVAIMALRRLATLGGALGQFSQILPLYGHKALM